MKAIADQFQQRIVSDSVDFLYCGLAKVVVTITLIPLVLVAVMWERVPHDLLLVWLALSLLVALVRVVLAWRYQRRPAGALDAARWGWRFAATSLAEMVRRHAPPETVAGRDETGQNGDRL